MPALSEIASEILAARAKDGDEGVDLVRHAYMRRLAEATGNNVALYASCFLQRPEMQSDREIVDDEDVRGFMNVLAGLDDGKDLDLILHSPGGSLDAAGGVADYLHQHFAGRRIRVIVPYMAMSAATLLACAGNSVMMGEHSSLGPVDPQIWVMRDGQERLVAGHAIIQEFNAMRAMAREFGAEGFSVVGLRYGMGIISECKNQMARSDQLVRECLARRMFAGEADAEDKAKHIAKYLASHANFKSHAHRVSFGEAKNIGLRVERLEDDKKVQDAVLSVFHALCIAFSVTPAAKIIENHNGRAFVQME